MLRLLIYNLANRMGELGERLIHEPLFGETLIDHVKARWQSPNRPKVSTR